MAKSNISTNSEPTQSNTSLNTDVSENLTVTDSGGVGVRVWVDEKWTGTLHPPSPTPLSNMF